MAEHELHHYIRYYSPGLVRPGSHYHRIPDREKPAPSQMPQRAYAFQFYDVLTITRKIDGRMIEFTSEKLNRSDIYFPGADRLTIADVRQLVVEGAESKTLLDNMECNGWETVIRGRHGGYYQPKNCHRIITSLSNRMEGESVRN